MTSQDGSKIHLTSQNAIKGGNVTSQNGIKPYPKMSEAVNLTEIQKTTIEEALLKKRECVKIALQKDGLLPRCKCGRVVGDHVENGELGTRRMFSVGDKWSPELNTATFPTDAYGTIEFQGGSTPGKAKFVRLAFDTCPDKILSLLLNSWKLQLPNLLISIQGGISNFDLPPKLQQAFRAGLLKAAKTTGAWIIASGTNTGVMRHVGDALGNTLMQSRNNIVTIGIAPWGVVQNNQSLIGTGHVIEYHAVPEPSSSSVLLSPNQSYFLLADNGSLGSYGSDIILRKRFEKYLSQQKFAHRSGNESCSIPVVCLVLEGGTNTIRTVLEYVTDRPPVPIVVCDGSGRAADLLAFAYKYSRSDGTLEESLSEQLKFTIERIFQYTRQQAEKLLTELLLCIRNKELVTVLNVGEGSHDLDVAILTALLRGKNSSVVQKLGLVMSWDRADIARSHIFVYGQEWPHGALDEAMMNALAMDSSDFVKLLLENGVDMQKWLTISRLEELYNIVLSQKVLPTRGVFATSHYQQRQDSASTLRYLLQEYRKDVAPGGRFSLADIGQVINKLMGGVYRSEYSTKSFRMLCSAVLKQGFSLSNILGQIPIIVANISLHQGFRYPFSHLMIWAVLLRRHRLAKFMWEHGEEAMAKALVAHKLYKSMACKAAEDELESDFVEELKQCSKEFSSRAMELLELCYQTDVDLTRQLLTYELSTLSRETCLSLAASSEFQEFLAHSCCQILVTEMWLGGLVMRKYSTFKVILGILFFPSVLFLEYKTKEQLQQMPQTAEEHKNLMDRQSSRSSASSDEDDEEDEDEEDEDGDEDNSGEEAASNNKSRKRHRSPSKTEPDKVARESSSGSRRLISTCESDTNPRRMPSGDLNIRTKIYEFYTAPVTKFWMFSISYCLFLLAFCYMLLVQTHPMPSWVELYVILYVAGLGLDKFREILTSEPKRVSQKLRMFFSEWWNVVDIFAIVLFFVGVVLRLFPDYLLHARVFYGLTFMIWVVRIVVLFSVNKHLGPYVKMIWIMLKDLLKFVVFLLIVLMAFGLIRQAITYPNNIEFNWDLIREIFHEPYFMLYGEVYAPEIDPMCANGTEFECVPGRWIVPAAMSIFLIIGNILLLSLLIAIFNNTFVYISSITNQVWKSQRYFLVVDYESKPFLPPPLVILSHVLLICKCLIRHFKGKPHAFDRSLKLYLTTDEVEKLHDFEEECMQDLSRKQNHDVTNSDEKLIEIISEKVDRAMMRIEDLSMRENSVRLYLQSIDARLAQLQEMVLQTAQVAQVLHRHIGGNNQLSGATPSLKLQPSMPLRSAMKQAKPPSRFFSVPVDTDAGVPTSRTLSEFTERLANVPETGFRFSRSPNVGLSAYDKDDGTCSDLRLTNSLPRVSFGLDLYQDLNRRRSVAEDYSFPVDTSAHSVERVGDPVLNDSTKSTPFVEQVQVRLGSLVLSVDDAPVAESHGGGVESLDGERPDEVEGDSESSSLVKMAFVDDDSSTDEDESETETMEPLLSSREPEQSRTDEQH